jgi:hypothetical protein
VSEPGTPKSATSDEVDDESIIDGALLDTAVANDDASIRAGSAGACQVYADGLRCPYEAAWRGVLHAAHNRYEVETCDRHRAGILDAVPIDGNWEWRRAPEVESARQHGSEVTPE